MDKKPTIGISVGDTNGIGYEIIIKALANDGITDIFTPIIFGNQRNLVSWCRILKQEDFHFNVIHDLRQINSGRINLINAHKETEINPGTPCADSAMAAVESLKAATDALDNKEIDALITAPICKQTVNCQDFPFTGHTEFLNARFGNEQTHSLMILFNASLRVALATTHLPVTQIAQSINEDKIAHTIRRFNDSLKKDFGIQRPKIAVLSLNPHSSDGGILGNEEETIITPAIEQCRKDKILAFGPLAADGLFGSGNYQNFDGVLAMYHDQGLAPFKAIAGNEGVNFTAGLPVVRTSPDHGTGFDIAGKGVANPDSMRQAIYEAIDIVRTRKSSTPCTTE